MKVVLLLFSGWGFYPKGTLLPLCFLTFDGFEFLFLYWYHLIRTWKKISLFLVRICGCAFSREQSVGSYFPMFLFAGFYCTRQDNIGIWLLKQSESSLRTWFENVYNAADCEILLSRYLKAFYAIKTVLRNVVVMRNTVKIVDTPALLPVKPASTNTTQCM